MSFTRESIAEHVQSLINLCHTASFNRGWWNDQATGLPLLGNEPHLTELMGPYVKCTKLMLVTSEIAECMEGIRTNAPDDKLPNFSMETVEIADAIIRLFDYAGAYKLPVVEAIMAKMDFNAVRKDHDVAVRAKPGGKKF